MNKEELYIGWMAKAPAAVAKFIKRYLIILIPIVIVMGFILAVSQKKFSTAQFEFGQLTTVQGIYFEEPIPALRVTAGRDIFGQPSYITIPLIGYGKHGVEGAMEELEKEQKTAFHGKEISLKGTLLYHDGKIIMQIDHNDKPLVSISSNTADSTVLPHRKELGQMIFRGEIIDPKCYFGVMKPGEGKPHRDCAIRCILGGMPPMLTVTNDRGERNYYIMLGSKGEKINERIKDYVAEPIEIHARAVQYDDWIVLYTEAGSDIREISKSAFFQPDVAMTCKMK